MEHWERSPPTKEARVLYLGPSVRLRLRESKSQSRMRTEMGKMRENIPEGEFVFEQSGAPFPARGLIILVTKRPSSAPFWTVQVMILTVSGCHFSSLSYKFYVAWWLRVASWRCLSGFMVYRNSCSTSLACSFSNWIRFSRKLGRSDPDFGGGLLPCHFTIKKRWRRLYFPKLRVRIEDNNNSPHGKFHRFLFPFSSKISDVNFASYVFYIYPCYVTSLGYLWVVKVFLPQ